MALHVKKGDMVKIIAGDHKGSVGKVLHVLPRKDGVLIQGMNTVKKHVKPSRKNPQGGRISIEKPIHISNILPVNPKTSKASKVKFVIAEDGSKKRVAADGTEIGIVKKAKK